jgi:ligand-binding sensor domain-containing protein
MVHALVHGPDGAIWAATSEGVVRFDGKEWRALGSAEISARGMVVDRKRRVWVATHKGLRVMDPGQTDPGAARTVIAGRMRDVTLDGFGRVWAMSASTIALIDER